MGDVALTAANIACVDPKNCETYNVEAGTAITKGQILCWDTDGQVLVADGNQAALDEPVGVALEAGVAGKVISMLVKGLVYGFTVSGINTGTLLTLSDTIGAVETAGAGEQCGRVWALSGGETTDYVAFFDFDIGAASV